MNNSIESFLGINIMIIAIASSFGDWGIDAGIQLLTCVMMWLIGTIIFMFQGEKGKK